MKAFLIALVIAVLSAQGGRAEVLEIPLSNALGTYPRSGDWPTGDYASVDTVTFGGPRANVLSAQIRIEGSMNASQLSCCLTYVCPDTVPWGMVFDLIMKRIGDPGYSWEQNWRGSFYHEEAGVFDITADVRRTGGFSQLQSGDRVSLNSFFGPMGFVAMCSELWPAPYGTVLGATLLLDVEYVVATENSTWGRIKSIYE